MAKRENEAAAAVHVKLELEQDRGALKSPMLLCCYPVASVNTLWICSESHTSDKELRHGVISSAISLFWRRS